MFRHRFSDELSFSTAFHWFLLAFIAGAVNAGAFMACQRFATHMTGFATLFGVDAATGRLDAAFGILSVPLFFLFGTIVAAYLVDRPFHEQRKSHYSTVMGLTALCLAAAAVGGHYGYFSEFGQEIHLRKDYVFLALLCMASGLQNSAISTASGATVRSTHLTGTITDMGIGIVKLISFWTHHDGQHLKEEVRALRLRGGVVGAFALGALGGSVLCLRYRYLGFLMPCALALYTMLVARAPVRGSKSSI